MKKLREARASKLKLFGLAIALIVCFGTIGTTYAATQSVKSSVTAAGVTSLAFAAPIGLTRLAPEPGGEQGGSKQEVIEIVKVEAAKAAKDECIAQFKTLLDSNEDIKGLKALSDQIKKANTEEELKKLKSMIEEIGLTVKANSEMARIAKSKTFVDQVVDAYKGIKADDIEKLKTNRNHSITLELKSAGTVTTSNVTASDTGAIPFTLSDNEEGLTRISRRNPFIVDIANVRGTNKPYVQWAEQKNPDGGAGMTAEGAAKTQADFDIVEASKKVEKVTAYMKVSKEMLDDVAYIEGEIRSELMELVKLKLDAQVLDGDGNTPNLKGVLQYAQAFSPAAGLLNNIDYANYFDVVRAAINQIVTASGGDSNFSANFYPNYLIVHPTDAAKMEMTKDDNGQYILPPFTSNSGTNIKGVRVIENTGMTQGEFLLGDFTKLNVRMREDAVINVGYEMDDFTKNLVTILCEMRATCYVKSNHVNAFVTGDWDDALADLRNANS